VRRSLRNATMARTVSLFQGLFKHAADTSFLEAGDISVIELLWYHIILLLQSIYSCNQSGSESSNSVVTAILVPETCSTRRESERALSCLPVLFSHIALIV
jgi:hypothetical protein